MNVPDGKTTTVMFTGDDDGDLPEYEPEIRDGAEEREMIALLLALLAQPAAVAPPPADVDPVGHYLADLEKAGVLGDDKQPATLDRLKAELAGAEDDLVTGNPEVASVRLYRIVESPRYAQFSYAPDYATAELTLARALMRAGGYKSAERYLLRVLARGAKAPQFAPGLPRAGGHRAGDEEEAAILAVLDHAQQSAPTAAAGRRRRARLPGRQGRLRDRRRRSRREPVRAGRSPVALLRGGAVLPRPHPGARGHFASARANLCEIVEQVDQDRFTFFIDGRYFAIKDLAYLALGRISHEQGKYDDAYYFYFRVPRTRSACRTRCSRRPGRCSRRASTRRRGPSSTSSTTTFPPRRWRRT